LIQRDKSGQSKSRARRSIFENQLNDQFRKEEGGQPKSRPDKGPKVEVLSAKKPINMEELEELRRQAEEKYRE
jgi:hypothetical protein